MIHDGTLSCGNSRQGKGRPPGGGEDLWVWELVLNLMQFWAAVRNGVLSR